MEAGSVPTRARLGAPRRRQRRITKAPVQWIRDPISAGTFNRRTPHDAVHGFSIGQTNRQHATIPALSAFDRHPFGREFVSKHHHRQSTMVLPALVSQVNASVIVLADSRKMAARVGDCDFSPGLPMRFDNLHRRWPDDKMLIGTLHRMRTLVSKQCSSQSHPAWWMRSRYITNISEPRGTHPRLHALNSKRKT